MSVACPGTGRKTTRRCSKVSARRGCRRNEKPVPGGGDHGQAGLAAYKATGDGGRDAYYIALLAKACETAEQMEVSLSLLDNALQIVERTEERWFAAELNRHKGQVLLRQGQSEAAEELYRRALSITEEQSALSGRAAAVNTPRAWGPRLRIPRPPTGESTANFETDARLCGFIGPELKVRIHSPADRVTCELVWSAAAVRRPLGRFAPHSRYQVGERDPGSRGGPENRAAPFHGS